VNKIFYNKMISGQVSSVINSIAINGEKKENLSMSGRTNNSVGEQQIVPISSLKNTRERKASKRRRHHLSLPGRVTAG
jgi:hypothetical protein